MQPLITICNVIAAILGVLYAYRAVFMVVGLFRTKRYQPAKKRHRYAILIAARNEERVIGNLLRSIAAQDYPAELLTTFVVADNASDRTAEIARAQNAVCYERKDSLHCTKGYALQFLLEQIERDYRRDSFDGYFIFDADNLLMHDYISRMNDAFAAGERVVVSYRNTKNLGDGCLSASYALHWLRTCRMEHCGRSVFGISGRIQGTGVLFGNEFVRDGWNYTSLTEDRAFSSDIVAAGVTIAYQHEARFYDEQPNSLRIAFRQRLRWAKGNLQAFTETAGRLISGIFRQRGWRKRLSCYDMLMFNFPSSVVTIPAKLLKAALITVLAITAATPTPAWYFLLFQVIEILIFEHFSVIPMGILLFITERRQMPKLKWYQYLGYALTFPIFGLIGDIVMMLAVFVKVGWKPIPHHADISIDSLEAPTQEQASLSEEPEPVGRK